MNALTIKAKNCGECGRQIRNGEIFYYSGRKYRCCDCAEHISPAKRKTAYVSTAGNGALLFTRETFLALDDGKYGLASIDGKTVLTGCVNLDSGGALEIHDGKVLMMFEPMARLGTTYLSDMFGEACASEVTRFVRVVGCRKPMAVFDSEDQSFLGLTNAYDLDFEILNNGNIYDLSVLSGMAYTDDKCNFATEVMLSALTPEIMLELCQDRIKGQDTELKKAVYLVYNYLKCISSQKPFTADNWFLTAPSGSGKTEFYRVIKDIIYDYKIPIPIVQIDLSRITEEGFRGQNTSSIPKRIISEGKSYEGYGICFFDETDKKLVPSYAGGANVNAAVQSNLLTFIEGIELKVDYDENEYLFDTSKTMFVFMGAFQDLRNKIQSSLQKKHSSLGFAIEEEPAEQPTDTFYSDITIDDIINYGMVEEMAGRLTQVINFHRMSDKDMLDIIKQKTEQLSASLGFAISITDKAANELLAVSFSELGVRRPVNKIKELVHNAVAEAFFDGGFDAETDMVVINSSDTAKIVHKSGKTHRDKPTEHLDIA